MSSGCAIDAKLVIQKVTSSKADIHKPWICRLSSRSSGSSSSSCLSMVLRNTGLESCEFSWEYTGRVFELSHHSDSDPYVKLQDGFRKPNFWEGWGCISMQGLYRGNLKATSPTSPSPSKGAFTSSSIPAEASSRCVNDVLDCRRAVNFHLKMLLKHVASAPAEDDI